MNDACAIREPRLCGCCEGLGPETPELIANRPGLSAIAYRVGRHPTFKASMLAALSDPDLPQLRDILTPDGTTFANALRALRTREDGDFTIALLDAWATAADILTFYQERIANESYLRTAVDGRSLIELARLVGYRPSPGVAASTVLAFTLSTAPGSPERVTIPAGSRVQSVPGPGETPRVFETATDVVARAGYNAIPAQTTVPWTLSPGDTSAWIAGTANRLNPGDLLLFVGAGFEASDPINSGQWDFHFITSVATDPIAGTTFVTWDSGLASWFPAGAPDIGVYVLRKKAGLFGAQAPDPRTLSADSAENIPGWNSATSDWSFAYAGGRQVGLDVSYPGLAVSAGGDPQWVVFISPDWVYAPFRITSAQDAAPMRYTLTAKSTQLTLADEPWLDDQGNVIATTDQLLTTLVAYTRSVTAHVQSEPLTPAAPPFAAWAYDRTYARQAGLLRPVEGSSLEIVGGQQLAAGRPAAVNGKRIRLRVADGGQAAFVPEGSSAALAVGDGDAFIVDAFPALAGSAEVAGAEMWQVLTTSGIPGTLHVISSNLTLLPAGKNDAAVGEAVVIAATSVSGSIMALAFAGGLSRIYDRATVTVNANAVEATDGETTHEILGSGDAANPALRCTLKQSPLTYTGAPAGLGARSTLQVWVNNLQWLEVDDFLRSGPADRVFTTRTGDTGAVTVQFGDGIAGGRTPTGQMNLRATYRKGVGAAGNVRAGQLSQPVDRPQGVAGVTNPSPAAGGANPDPAGSVRTSAPLHVLTLDRVVSLEDYQNYARAFAGIAKALATWTSFGRTRGVFLTVAGAGGAMYRSGDSTIVHLAQALRDAGNAYVPLLVRSYVPVLFEVGAAVRVDVAQYDSAQVLAAVWQALVEAFDFERRDLGQGVAQSEVLAVIQSVSGVIAVRITSFARSGQGNAPGGSPAVLRAASPLPGSRGTPQAAEMLLLDPASRGGIGVWS